MRVEILYAYQAKGKTHDGCPRACQTSDGSEWISGPQMTAWLDGGPEPAEVVTYTLEKQQEIRDFVANPTPREEANIREHGHHPYWGCKDLANFGIIEADLTEEELADVFQAKKAVVGIDEDGDEDVDHVAPSKYRVKYENHLSLQELLELKTAGKANGPKKKPPTPPNKEQLLELI